MRLLVLLIVAVFVNLLEARPQDFIGPSSESFYDGGGGSTLASSDQPFTFESNPSAYDGSGITAQPQTFTPTDLGLSSDIAYLASPFVDTGDFDTNDDSLFPPSLFASTALSAAEPDVEIGDADHTLYDDDLTISYDKFPLYTWPSDENRRLFPFNCWKEDKDGFLCKDNHCQMGTSTASFFSLLLFLLPLNYIFHDRLTVSPTAAFVYSPGDIGTRFCCEKWDDLVRRPESYRTGMRNVARLNRKRY